MTDRARGRLVLGAWLALVVAVAAGARVYAVPRLLVAPDEFAYCPVGHHYGEMMHAGRWGEIPRYERNLEHPPLVKLAYGVYYRLAGLPFPDGEGLEMFAPVPPAYRAELFGPRAISAVLGTAQVLVAALAAPLGGPWLALDGYHVQFTSLGYLEAMAGLWALLCAWLFERATRSQGAPRPAPATGPLLASAAALGLAAASKYPYALVLGGALLPFLAARLRPTRIAAYLGLALAVFWAADPFLWHDPLRHLWRSLTFHAAYTHDEAVVRAAIPWYDPLAHLAGFGQARWRPELGVGWASRTLLPAALLSLPVAWRRGRLWVAWAAVGVAFLCAWPTRWPQHTLVVRAPLAVCAGFGAQALLGWCRARLRRPAAPPAISATAAQP